MVDLASTARRALPESNEAGLELVARHMSAAKVEAFRDLGLRIVQGHRVPSWSLRTASQTGGGPQRGR
jgi:hypothetical protein